MGIRADITPQAARIDAHCLSRQGPVRLCYADSVLHTKPRGLLSSRVPIRVGAELYGHAGVECDIELICLMHETLRAVDIADVHVVLGHVGIFRTLVQEAQLDESTERDLFEALQRKAYDEIDGVLAQSVKDESLRGLLTKLSRLSGDEATLQEAVDAFANAPAAVQKELQELVAIVEGVKKRVPDIVLCFDLCELSGYEYHTGIVFAAYTPDHGRAVAKGGRYDHIGEVFGRSRPASGFDSDLKTLAKLSAQKSENPSVVMAPSNDDPNLVQLVADLRGEGIIVVSNLNSEAMSADELNELNCDKHIVQKDGKWQVENL